MENLQIVTFDGIKCYEENGVCYLELEGVARGLGFTQVKNDVEYVKWERVNGYLKDFGFSPEAGKDTFIPENVFFRLAMKAKNEAAEKFQAKVADEILPSIRKHGIYATDKVIDDIINNPDFGIELLTRLKEERQARIEAERKNAILTHVNKTYTATEIAKELGMKSAVELNKDLCNKGIQYKVNETYVLYSEYANLGFTEIKQQILDNGKVIYHRKFTQYGREFILNLYK